MIRLLAIITLIISAHFGAHAQSDSLADLPEEWSSSRFQALRTNIIKISPSHHGSDFWGGSIAYETTIGNRLVTIQLSARSVSGLDSLTAQRYVEAHQRYELQARYYPKTVYRGGFLAPSLIVNSNGELAGGLMGGSQFYWRDFVLDLSLGFITATPTDNSLTGNILGRYYIGLGYKFKL